MPVNRFTILEAGKGGYHEIVVINLEHGEQYH